MISEPNPIGMLGSILAGALLGQLHIPHCPSCQTYFFPQRPVCLVCYEALGSKAVSGRGTLASYAVVHGKTLPEFQVAVPFIIGIVELDEDRGIRLVGQFMGDTSQPGFHVGAPVRVRFVEGVHGLKLPQWELA